MNLKPIKANMTEVSFGKYRILFSYETPVAYEIVSGDQSGVYRTDKFWSRTTTRHINQWLNGRFASNIEQKYLDNIVLEVK